MSKTPATTTPAAKTARQFEIAPEQEAALRASILTAKPVLLIGHTGTGKTTIIREIGKEFGKTLHRVSLNGSTGIEEVVGKWLVKDGSTYWQDGILTQAMRNGDWIVFDEINAALPEILFCLHSVLDDARALTIVERDCEVLPAHEEFRFFSTMNPTEDYAGTKDLNRALLSRFACILDIKPPSLEAEVNILVKMHGVEEAHATSLIALAHQLRALLDADKILYFCSTRDLIHAGHLAKHIPLTEAIKFAIMAKMAKEEVALCPDIAHLVTSTKHTNIMQVIGRVTDLENENKTLKDQLRETTGLIAKIKAL